MTLDAAQPEAGPSRYTPGPTPYYDTSQYLHWRYTPEQLSSIRAELNAKSVEVVSRNSILEEAAQKELGNEIKPPPPATYLSVEDELLLLKFYISQVSTICRKGFGLTEIIEATAISYLKRFYLKNSVMEWHPKNIMPTCLYLASKSHNNPIPLDIFVSKFAKLTKNDVLDTEFLVAQSLSFEFWTRGADKPLRGWALEFQNTPNPPIDSIQSALPTALEHLTTSRLTDAEFLYTPSQIALACWSLADNQLVANYLTQKYPPLDHVPKEGDAEDLPFGLARDKLEEVIGAVTQVIKEAEGGVDVKLVKGVDKRLRGCTNPEKVPGTALYIKRKKEQDQAAMEAKAEKSKAASAGQSDIFGDTLRKPLSPRVTVASPAKRVKLENAVASPVKRVKLEDSC